ncbi:helix-turn-helix transcriptional regulator [Alkalihalobacterium elongatum]|uniref:helix-turn-helix transcriptional regulator n=1 Tax=Alkalihalobacterium elongatum TaxID=2675466 RepID=UPI001C1F2960|nr:WYL domain-containing protein [Alkalihalobacterium elongatum]
MRDVSGKDRLLKIKDLLQRETDESHELAIDEIIEKLRLEFGDSFSVDKKAVKDDIESLSRCDFEVIEHLGKFGKKYYSYQSRLFELYELRLLIDAILSARFITKKDSEALILKIKKLTSKHLAKNLPSQIFYDQSVKGNYYPIKVDIDRLHIAITENKTVKFKYGKYNVNKEFEYRRNGIFYQVKPYALVWNNDFYYLLGIFEDEKELRPYRVDRMRKVEVTNKSFQRMPVNISEHVHKTFHMYAGKEEWIKIRFKNDLINVVFDRFGLDVDIKKIDDSYFLLNTKAAVSDGLVAWILTWGSDAKVIAPISLVRLVTEEVKKMFQQY